MYPIQDSVLESTLASPYWTSLNLGPKYHSGGCISYSKLICHAWRDGCSMFKLEHKRSLLSLLLLLKLCHSNSSCCRKGCPLPISLCWSWHLSDSTISWFVLLSEQKNLNFLPVGLFYSVLTPRPAHQRVKTSISAAPMETAGGHPSGKGREAFWQWLSFSPA